MRGSIRDKGPRAYSGERQVREGKRKRRKRTGRRALSGKAVPFILLLKGRIAKAVNVALAKNPGAQRADPSALSPAGPEMSLTYEDTRDTFFAWG